MPRRNDIESILVIGAGPHALSLVLRLLEGDPELLSERERGRMMLSVQNQRAEREVLEHVREIRVGRADAEIDACNAARFEKQRVSAMKGGRGGSATGSERGRRRGAQRQLNVEAQVGGVADNS